MKLRVRHARLSRAVYHAILVHPSICGKKKMCQKYVCATLLYVLTDRIDSDCNLVGPQFRVDRRNEEAYLNTAKQLVLPAFHPCTSISSHLQILRKQVTRRFAQLPVTNTYLGRSALHWKLQLRNLTPWVDVLEL